ncbi:hypothetical protein [Alicyclobacillus fastidiosus]|uniref:RNA polymerase sigma-70 region 4 domain-containing protein n=1 Tax=Alicyclobacillus fastidiosus TaxID=392011 RepID=A0ABV5AK77_9BACL|nr:hypothetical protein [Alicyclobacillus fastidiosus]WEH09296.1 hypothetical protein PYS47_21910 [Alicyclobacillus fastidiosus]
MSHVALIEFDLLFSDEEVEAFRRFWDMGTDVKKIAKKMHRHEIEIGALILDQAELGHIEPRTEGLQESLPYLPKLIQGPKRRRLLPTEIRLVQTMFETGAPAREIAERFGVTTEHIRRLRREHGWEPGARLRDDRTALTSEAVDAM